MTSIIERIAGVRSEFRECHRVRSAQTIAVKRDDLQDLCVEILEKSGMFVDKGFRKAVMRGGDALEAYIRDHELEIYGMKIVVVDTVLT